VTDVLTTINTRSTPQAERADERQVANNAGGYVFELDDVTRLRRFLVLGTDGGTYYTSARDLTRDNAGSLMRLISVDPVLVVNTIVDISVAGRAPKANPALFALAAVAGTASDEGRQAAFAALPKVARIGTHLFLFARYVEQFRGWGRGLRHAVGDWYLDMPVDDLAYQAVKYRQREGWSHRDLLRLSHPETPQPERRALFDWICGRPTEDAPALVGAFTEAQTASADRVVSLIGEYPLTWEMLPDTALDDPRVWHTLIAKGMPQTALIRQLPRLTRLGILTGDTGRAVAEQIADPDRLRKARVHPVNVLVAQRTYASGQSARGAGTWAPARRIVDALDAAFYASFGAVEPTGKRLMLALDVSASMTWGPISGMPITPREASAALSLVTAATEDDYEIVGFSTNLRSLAISPRQRLDDAIATIERLPMGGTDCSLPMLHALEAGQQIDTFVVYTDNETWAGRIHPHQALRQYRERTGIDARLIVVGMTSTGFTIADPTDPGMLDVAGFDSAVPALISDFTRGL